MRILLIGNRGGTNVGASFERAAIQLRHTVSVLEPRVAFAGPLWLRRINWWMLGRRPVRLSVFDSALLASVAEHRPDLVIAVGISPPGWKTAGELRRQRVKLVNYLTDDPWQRNLQARWFIKSLRGYYHVFSTKRAILEDLRKVGSLGSSYLPFGYDPAIQFPEAIDSDMESAHLASDVFFAGGGDRDRFRYLRALIESGLKVAIHGEYWDRDPVTRAASRGHAYPAQLRHATAAAKICLCLVRRANRDGHVMRTFEIAATGGCMLAEDTTEHRELFGAEGECVVYFANPAEMVRKAKWLIDHPDDRRRLAAAAHERITGGRHTYADRLQEMLEVTRGIWKA